MGIPFSLGKSFWMLASPFMGRLFTRSAFLGATSRPRRSCHGPSPMREMAFRGEPLHKLREYARTTGGMATLMQDGVRKVQSGLTSLDEILRVTVTND